jgi:hypothetical protein
LTHDDGIVAVSGNPWNAKRTERSRQITENKGEQFSRRLESRQVFDNKAVIFVKPWSY